MDSSPALPHAPADRRPKVTPRRVIVADRLADWTITVGGLLVILAVVGIMVFLVRVALPLATGGEAGTHVTYRVAPPKKVAWLNVDEYRTLGIRVAADGAVSTVHLASGRTVASDQLGFGGATATAVGGTVRRDQLAFGFADGTVRFATVGYDIAVVTPERLPARLEQLDERDRLGADAIYSQLPGDQYRRVALAASVGEPQRVSDAPITALDYRVGGTAERPTRSFVTFDAQGVGRISRAETRINLLSRKETTRISTSTLPALPGGTSVTAVALTSQADAVYVATGDGRVFRFDVRRFDAPVLAETRRAFTDGSAITAMAFLIGDQALAVGGSNGAVDVYFTVPAEGTADGNQLVRARRHVPHGAAVVSIAASQRSKSLVTYAANGEVWVRHSTSDQVLLRFARSPAQGSTQVLLTPRVDGVVMVEESGRTDYWPFYFPHPGITPRAVFGEVWYEGYPEPTHTWQSSSGTDVFEPKFSLVPLVFGTLKATVYALVFAIPIALLSAIYTSEFLHRRVRATVKPVMEMMESLPTVVLGFIAALILAPIVEEWIAAVLLAFLALPLGLLTAAYLWQMLPPELALRLRGLPKLAAILAVVLASMLVAYHLGPAFEWALFDGDFKAWTNGDHGSGLPFTFLLGLPLAFCLALWGFRAVAGDRYRLHLRELTPPHAALLDAGRFAGILATAALASYAGAGALTALGFDPRGGVVDSYVQRNALVVGFVMGFAVIPNIYTLAEDALNSVPSDLRAGSLAAGATPWQTAMWIILPTALSGVFAACMIGMGRAVGETMIVVMAAGNTPVLDWNIFNGLRTLSANIAVELPEAVKDGTLYRMLFLAALTLFAMTFVVNTVAEVIRQRFRRRAFQL